MNGYNKKRYDRIVGEYFRGELPSELDEMIREWLTDSFNDKEKDKAMADLFYKEVAARKRPDRNTTRSLRQMKIRLGWKVYGPLLPAKKLFRIAAALIPAMLITAALVIYTNPATNDPNVETIVERITSDNNLRTILLPDGSKVTLNEGSTLSYGQDRKCTLHGEAYFTVAPGEVPFVVTTDRVEVTVLGTRFNLSAYPGSDHSLVELYHGSVKLTGTDLEHTLVPGQALRLNHSTLGHELFEIDTAGAKPGWLRQALAFDGRPLGEVFDRIASYFNVTIENSELINTAHRYSLRLEGDEGIELVMSMLEAASGGEFGYSIKDNRVIIEPTGNVREN